MATIMNNKFHTTEYTHRRLFRMLLPILLLVVLLPAVLCGSTSSSIPLAAAGAAPKEDGVHDAESSSQQQQQALRHNSHHSHRDRKLQLLGGGFLDDINLLLPRLFGTISVCRRKDDDTYETEEMLGLIWIPLNLIGIYQGVEGTCEEKCPCGDNGTCRQVSSSSGDYDCNCNTGYEFNDRECVSEDAECTRNSDCNSGFVCEDDVCVPDDIPPDNGCTNNSDCDPDEVCVDDIADNCNNDPDCPKVCVPAPPDNSCTDNSDCDSGFECVDDICVREGTEESCDSTDECDQGFVCVDDITDNCNPLNESNCRKLCVRYPTSCNIGNDDTCPAGYTCVFNDFVVPSNSNECFLVCNVGNVVCPIQEDCRDNPDDIGSICY